MNNNYDSNDQIECINASAFAIRLITVNGIEKDKKAEYFVQQSVSH